jgi:hypothetical protein
LPGGKPVLPRLGINGQQSSLELFAKSDDELFRRLDGALDPRVGGAADAMTALVPRKAVMMTAICQRSPGECVAQAEQRGQRRPPAASPR